MSNRQAEPARMGSKSSRVPLDSRDERDAESIFLTINPNFGGRSKPSKPSWHGDATPRTRPSPSGFDGRRFGRGQPTAASYRRISTAFPGYMDRLQELLLPVLREIIVPY